VVNSPKGSNNLIKHPFGTSIYDLKAPAMPMASHFVIWSGLRLFSPAASLVRITESFIARNPVETQLVLTHLGYVSDLLRLLLNGGHSSKAGCLAGALQQLGRSGMADEILGAMKSAGYDVRESNPFEASQVFGPSPSL
jgi:hypothetical protein